MAAGSEHSLAVTHNGSVWVWGDNKDGQLGDGSRIQWNWPDTLSGMSSLLGVAGGEAYSLYLSTQGEVLQTSHLLGTWPADGNDEQDVQRIVVAFDHTVHNVSADDLMLSAGTVTGVEGTGKGPYVFAVTGLPETAITATLGRDITGEDNRPLAGYNWSFQNLLPPEAPGECCPAPSQADVAVGVALSWNSGQETAGERYDVYLDTVNPPAVRVSSGQSAAMFRKYLLAGETTYYWRVVAIDGGGRTPGPVWSFTTLQRLSGDADGNEYVNVGDLQKLISAWGSRNDGLWSTWNRDADFDNSGSIDVGDLQALAANWGRSAY